MHKRAKVVVRIRVLHRIDAGRDQKRLGHRDLALYFVTQTTLLFFHQAPENADISFGFSGKRQVCAEASSKAVQGHVMSFCEVRKTLSAS